MLIQAPGRGSSRATAGMRLASAKGAASPNPSAIRSPAPMAPARSRRNRVRRQYAGGEGAEHPSPPGVPTADAGESGAELSDPGEAQPHREQEIGEQADNQ